MGEWVLGWVSAAGAYHVREALRVTDADAITSWVDKYCRENPIDPLHEAAQNLVVELAKPK